MQILSGHLSLVCSLDESGRSHISRQSFCAPFHISKPYQDEHALMVQVVNPTAGLFSGDSLQSEICVEHGARLHISTPSASRIHTMHSGRAELHQSFHVAEAAWLEYNPAALIPQKTGRYRQITRITLAAGAETFFIETLAPGRVARGECFEFSRIDWDLTLTYDHQLIAAERYHLSPSDDSLAALRYPFPSAWYASGYLITERIAPCHNCWEQIRKLNSPDVLLGASRLVKAGWSLRVVARDNLILQKTLSSLRKIFSETIPELRSGSRKL
ncbi:MAG: Urease accessory protein UreD [Verrucomicrobiales bacterium]|nr:Urease accessory protein UreD [Verrucomicrobiales bacterium]